MMSSGSNTGATFRSPPRTWVGPGTPVNQLAVASESRIRLWFALLTALTAYLGAWGCVASLLVQACRQAVQHDRLGQGQQWSKQVLKTIAPEISATSAWSHWLALALALGVAVSAFAYLTDSLRFFTRFLGVFGHALLGPFKHYFKVLDVHREADGLTSADDRQDLSDAIARLRNHPALRFEGEVHLWAVRSDDPPAFTFGNHRAAHVCIGPTLLNADLSAARVRAILAHELAHVASGDLPLLALLDGLTRTLRSLAIVVVAGVWLFAAAAPPGSRIRDLALGLGLALIYGALFAFALLLEAAAIRQREFDADAVAAIALDDVGPIRAALMLDLPHDPSKSAKRWLGVERVLATHPDGEARLRNLQEILRGIPSMRDATIVAAGLSAMLLGGATLFALLPVMGLLPPWFIVAFEAGVGQVAGALLLLLTIRPNVEHMFRHTLKVFVLFTIGQLVGWTLVGVLPNLLSGHSVGEVSVTSLIFNFILAVGYAFALRTLLARSPSPWHFRSTTKILIGVFVLVPMSVTCAVVLAGQPGIRVKHLVPGLIVLAAVVPLLVRLLWRPRCQCCSQGLPARPKTWSFEQARVELCNHCGGVSYVKWFQAAGDEFGMAYSGPRDHAVVRLLRPLALTTLCIAVVCANAGTTMSGSRAVVAGTGTPNATLVSALAAARVKTGSATSRCATLEPLKGTSSSSLRLFTNELSERMQCQSPLTLAPQPGRSEEREPTVSSHD